MKQLFTYILIFALAVRPLYIAGHIAYYELNIEYITEKFCENKDKPQLQCNGKCHLAKELNVVSANLSDTEEKGVKMVTAYKSFTPLFYQKMKPSKLKSLAGIELSSKHLFFYKNNYTSIDKLALLKPPIV